MYIPTYVSLKFEFKGRLQHGLLDMCIMYILIVQSTYVQVPVYLASYLAIACQLDDIDYYVYMTYLAISVRVTLVDISFLLLIYATLSEIIKKTPLT